MNEITLKGVRLHLPKRFMVCHRCSGRGIRPQAMWGGAGLLPCPSCSGQGYVLADEPYEEPAMMRPAAKSPSKNKTAGTRLNIISLIRHSVIWLRDIWGPTPFRSTKVL